MQRRKAWIIETLEARNMLATLAGAVHLDHNGNLAVDVDDEPVAAAIVWADLNQNSLREDDEPTTRTLADGTYQLEDLPAGDVLVRMQPPPGLFQTSPSEYFAFHRDAMTGQVGLSQINATTGQVTQMTPAVGVPNYGLIQTRQGEYYAAGHVDDSLYKIDPVTGQQTKIGFAGKGLVGGLTYDPIMDKIYTLAHQDDTSATELNLYEIDRHTAALTRVGTGHGIVDVRSTSGVAFDMVNREVILFDNYYDQVIAYDLKGEGRKVFQFPNGATFYNLAFDGHRLLTFQTDASNTTMLSEIDIAGKKLVPIRKLSSSPLNEAAEVLSVNVAHRVAIAAADARLFDINFFANQMELPDAALRISAEAIGLTSPAKGLQIDFPLSGAHGINFCIGALPGRVTVEQVLSSPTSMTIKTSDGSDHLAIDNLPLVQIQMGAGHDTLEFTQPVQVVLAALADSVHGVDAIVLPAAPSATIAVDSLAIGRLSDSRNLTLHVSTDQVSLSAEAWRTNPSAVQGNTRRHVLAVDDVILQLDNGLGWHNPLLPEDTSRDGVVSAIDALLIINELNQLGPRSLSALVAADAAAEYVDTNGDNLLSPIDALLVISRLNAET